MDFSIYNQNSRIFILPKSGEDNTQNLQKIAIGSSVAKYSDWEAIIIKFFTKERYIQSINLDGKTVWVNKNSLYKEFYRLQELAAQGSDDGSTFLAKMNTLRNQHLNQVPYDEKRLKEIEQYFKNNSTSSFSDLLNDFQKPNRTVNPKVEVKQTNEPQSQERIEQENKEKQLREAQWKRYRELSKFVDTIVIQIQNVEGFDKAKFMQDLDYLRSLDLDPRAPRFSEKNDIGFNRSDLLREINGLIFKAANSCNLTAYKILLDWGVDDTWSTPLGYPLHHLLYYFKGEKKWDDIKDLVTESTNDRDTWRSFSIGDFSIRERLIKEWNVNDEQIDKAIKENTERLAKLKEEQRAQ